MESEIDLNQILTAIAALYGDNSVIHTHPEQREIIRKQASKWLGDLQRSVVAWKIADQLLHMKRDVNSCFFAAQTLRTKIQYHFGELPLGAHDSLKSSMLEHLSHITDDTYQGIVTQICVAIADLALHMVAWVDPIGELVKQFGPGSQMVNLSPLLEVLIALPEEQVSRQLKLGQNRRNHLSQYFKCQIRNIIELLHIIVSTETRKNENIHVKAFRCLASWFHIHSQDWVYVSSTCLVHSLLDIVKNPHLSPRLHEVGTDCVCSAIIMLEMENLPPLTTIIFAGVLQLEEAYFAAVAMEDINAVTNYTRIFTELGETLVETLVEQPANNNGCTQVLHLLLNCVGHHEWEVAEITFNFWYKLSEVVFRKNCDTITVAFKPYVERLIEALFRHCQIDPDHFRERVHEMIKDILFICGASSCFRQMSQLLHTVEVQKNWNLTEAALFILQSVAKNLLPEENELVQPILESVLLQENTINLQVQFTSLQFIGELNEWLYYHPKILPPVLTFLTKKLHNDSLATMAAKSLDLVCQSSKDHLQDSIDDLMQVVNTLDGITCISNEAVVGLLKGVVSIVGRRPREYLERDTKVLCLLQTSHLQKLLQEKKMPVRGTSNDPCIWLERLSAIFRSVNPIVPENEKHPCLDVVIEVWPVLKAVFHTCSGDTRIMEHCCKCLRFIIRCIQQQAISLLEEIIELLVLLYAKHGHSCFLYLGSVLVDEFGKDASCVSSLIVMLNSFSGPTFMMLTEMNGFASHPETVEDYFRLCQRYIKRISLPFLHMPVIPNILECGLQACLLDHREANSAVLKFFLDLIDVGINKEDQPDFQQRKDKVTEILDLHGQTLVSNLVTAALFTIPMFMQHDLAETVFEIMKFDRVKFCHWLEVKVKALPRHNAGGAEAVTEHQLAELHAVITKAERPKEISRAFMDFAKYYT